MVAVVEIGLRWLCGVGMRRGGGGEGDACSDDGCVVDVGQG